MGWVGGEKISKTVVQWVLKCIASASWEYSGAVAFFFFFFHTFVRHDSGRRFVLRGRKRGCDEGWIWMGSSSFGMIGLVSPWPLDINITHLRLFGEG